MNKLFCKGLWVEREHIISNMASLHRENEENDEDNFKTWGEENLKSYLLEREVPVGNRTKQGLINLNVFARRMGLKVVKSVRKSPKGAVRMNA